MRIAICDDEEYVREDIKRWVFEYVNEKKDKDEKKNNYKKKIDKNELRDIGEKIDKNEKIEYAGYEHWRVDVFKSGEEICGMDGLYDIIFLDIDMDGMDGIEAARIIRKTDKKVKIIYVTSYPDYVNGAFMVHAFAYLLKPIRKEKIFKQLDEAAAYSFESESVKWVEFLTETGVERFKERDIYYFEYMDRKISIYTVQGIFLMRGKIADVEKKMEEYGFATPHKSFVVNLYHVKSIKGYDITMMNEDLVPLSQKKSTVFRKKLSEFLIGYMGQK